MADEIAFTIPGETVTPVVTEAPTTPVIDPATGEPSLAPVETQTETVTETPAVVTPEKKPDDVEAALAVAARSSREARESKKQLATLQAELDALKAKPAGNADAEAKAAQLDAILKNPSLLFKHNWDADKLMKNILNPDAGVEPIDPVKLKAEILEEIRKSNEKTPEQVESEKQAQAAEYERGMQTATANVTRIIGESAKDYPMVDAEDARGIVEKVTKFCEDKNYSPTQEQAKNLVMQGIKGLHDKRMKRFGSKVGAAKQPDANQSIVTELGFTDGSSKPQHRPEPKPTATTPTSSGKPLPMPKPTYEIGFTS